MTIKIYECSTCKGLAKKGVKGFKTFKGTRWSVRKHLREEHGLKCAGKDNKGKRIDSIITPSMIKEDWDDQYGEEE